MTAYSEVSIASTPNHHPGDQTPHKICATILKHSLRALICSSHGSLVLKGHDFSRAKESQQIQGL
jgi:hypothetical protein